MYIKDLIRKKIEKKELDEEELHFFIQSYFKDEILEEQAAALIVLMRVNGMTEKEMAYISTAMAETGEELELYRISNKIVDIHTIGGIEDKVILIINSIMKAMKIPSAKIIGRELGMTDRLDSILGFKYNIEVNKIKDFVEQNGYILAKEPNNLAPVENKFYRLRNITACDHFIPLLAISMMSQKIAVGAKNIVFDITCGENAYVKELSDAKKLAKYLVQMGQVINRNVICIITKFNQPVGKCFGNLIEIKEIIDCLNGIVEEDLFELISAIGERAISLATGNKNYKDIRSQIISVIKNGEALNCFKEIIQNQGGDINFINNLKEAKNIIPVVANEEGFVQEINISKIRTVAQFLGAIRKQKDDNIDSYAGIEFSKKVGDYIKRGEIIAYIHTEDDPKIQSATEMVLESFVLSSKNIKNKQRVLEII